MHSPHPSWYLRLEVLEIEEVATPVDVMSVENEFRDR
jgi:hypothetical protein